ncbi:hypothetical protein [Candidatus Laterigemmans baculatus]|uniref:hypothetical protein n=1 Tax=Candidatus Laterigemmans baculatus TaxID=2770505 RepID=UPI0013D99C34|nr:hypothetical protein [Candidatus Laterigemmans baculatus]
MSTLLDEPQAEPRTQSPAQSHTTASEQLKSETTAVRLHIRWPGVRKTLSQHQRQVAADAFEADTKSVSAAKKLLDTSHPAFKAVTAVRSQAVAYWRGSTLPYIEPGVRLLRRQDVPAFDVHMASVRIELQEAVAELDRCYGELVDQARQRLGDLFDASDYPPSLSELFAIEWDYPSVEPPEYLRSVSPQLYEAECQRVRSRFEEAVQMAEQAFADELSQLVTHLADRLTGEVDGKPKVFRDSAVTNLNEFFDRFQRLNVRSNDQLDQLVEQARSVIRGVGPQDLRDRDRLRQQVAQELTRVEASLEGWMTDRPRRNILRRPR